MVLEYLYTYPIKSTRRISHIRVKVSPWGLDGDRRWMIVDENAKFLTQRELPKMALIQAVPLGEGLLLLSAAGRKQIFVDVPDEHVSTLEVSIWRDTVPAQVASDRASAWLTTFLGRSVRLVYMSDPTVRPLDPAYSKPESMVSFADGYPILCTTSASLSELNKKLPETIPMGRFRPNVVVSGDRPFGEDTWKRLQIGCVNFLVVKPCTRCVITTVDQNTASQGKEPLRTLSRFRKRNGKVYFGENLIPENTGIIHRGDTVKVLEFESGR